MKTDRRIINKRYEDRHKEERKARNGTFSTSMSREDLEELNKFLQENNIRKIDLVYTGWKVMESKITKK